MAKKSSPKQLPPAETVGSAVRIAVETVIDRTERVRQIEGMFDVPAAKKSAREWTCRLPLDDPEHADWSIGLVVGASGSGKTTLARALWPEQLAVEPIWPADRAIVDAFPAEMPVREVAALLSAVGFSSPPAWLRPHRCLSNGEQFRAAVALRLAQGGDPIVLDEFTSVVDRTVARIGSAAVAKEVRRRRLRLVAVTCHHDVEDWLDPDWCYDPAVDKFRWRRLRRRPAIELVIRQVADRRGKLDAWRLFGPHHYLDGGLNKTARCFVAAVDDRPAAFAAVVNFCHPSRPGWREHRVVCLPDFQGVGIGNALAEWVAGVFAATGRPYRSTTSSPAMIRHRARSTLWRMRSAPTAGAVHEGKTGMRGRGAFGRLVAAFEWRGPKNHPVARAVGLRLPRDP